MNAAQQAVMNPAPTSAGKDPHRIVHGAEFGWTPETLPFSTIPELFAQRVAELGDRPMMRQKELGLWRAYGWREVATIAAEIGAGLSSLGFAPGEVASVLANTSREWVWTDLGILGAGGVCNGVYPTDSASQLQFLCEDSSTTFLFVEDDEQLDKFLEVRDRLPGVRKAIVFDMEGLAGLDDPQVIGLERLRELGREHLKANPGFVEERRRSRGPSDVAILVYTSGTTGKPKGAMITHANLCAVLSGLSTSLFEGIPEGAERIAFLPLCHIAERMIGEYVPMMRRDTVNFVENPETVFENLREIQPHVFFAVPRVWEKIYSQVMITLSEAGRTQQLAYKWALDVGREVARRTAEGRAPGALLSLQNSIARGLVLNNVLRMMGLSRTRLALTGAAPISPELIRWYQSLGIPLREGWGMTETTAGGTVNPRRAVRPGSIGVPGPGLEMRIAEGTGEILLRGPNVLKGYLNQPEKTAEAIDAEGWLHTGDVGRVDDDGYFYITDRMKDIIITAGGKNVTPSEWENELKFSPYVTDAVVIGDKRPFLTALVMIDQENVEKFAQDHDVPFSNYTSLTRAKEVQDLIWREIERVNQKFARVEQVKKFRLIETQLTAEDEELTPTMKLKRKFVQQKYAPIIEEMYRG
ncbi:MAG TPA: long-chain fatty acid--CoA ligase [Burkholderiaceae bacterium]|nr:long-chain fatty acid--CoA ligase [Burkholderiaceae bacterium]